MKLPQVVVYETDGWLAGQIKRLAGENGWLVRESRQPEACLALLREAPLAVVLLKLEKDLVEGLTFLSSLAEHAPDCPVILVSDVKMEGSEQRAQLTALAFDLGVRYVLFPPLQQTVIEDLVSGFMSATLKRLTGLEANEENA